MSKFYKISDIDSLTISEIKQLYKDYINPEQVNIYNAFDYNDDIFEKAEGVYIFTKDGKKILDLTGGLGVLNHGHNHKSIIKERIKFQKKNKIEINKLNLSPYVAALGHNISTSTKPQIKKNLFC